MSTPITTIYERATRKIGGITGLVGSPSASNLVLRSLVGTTGDNTAYAGDLLWVLASDADSRERMITQWNDVIGAATVQSLTDIPDVGSTFILTPRENYSLGEMDEAWYKASRDTYRTYRQVVPITPDFRLQVMNELSWLQGSGRIDAVFRSDSPLMLHNEDFSLWQEGPNVAPDGYTLSGASATVERVNGGVRSLYAARVTADVGANATLYQDIPSSLTQWLTRRTFPIFTPMRAGAWVNTDSAAAIRVFIYDGSTTTYSEYATGAGYPEYITLSMTPNATNSVFRWGVEVDAGEDADVSWAGLMQNTVTMDNAYQIKDAGSQFYNEYQINNVVRNVGGQPVVEFQDYPATWGQTIVYSRRQFPTTDPYTESVEDQYAEILEAGMLVYLLQAQKPNQDRARLDRVLLEMTSIWNRRNTNQINLPIPRPPMQVRVGGA